MGLEKPKIPDGKLDLDIFFEKLFQKLISELKNDSNRQIEKRFSEAENEIANSLKISTGNNDITVEITSDDEEELYDLDWTYYPYILVFDGPKMEKNENLLGLIRSNDDLTNFINNHKKGS